MLRYFLYTLSTLKKNIVRKTIYIASVDNFVDDGSTVGAAWVICQPAGKMGTGHSGSGRGHSKQPVTFGAKSRVAHPA
jgi:hypothetical protein